MNANGSTCFVIDGPGTYIVKVHSTNRAGIGKAAYIHNVQVLATAESGISSSPESATPSSPESGTTVSPESGKKPGASEAVIIGGVLGSILFLVLAVIAFTFLRKFSKKRRKQSVQVLLSFWLVLHVIHELFWNRRNSQMLDLVSC